jgi:hypothetical protein
LFYKILLSKARLDKNVRFTATYSSASRLYTMTNNMISKIVESAPRTNVAVFHLNSWGNFCCSLINTVYL